mgnify:CR=1 FL=1
MGIPTVLPQESFKTPEEKIFELWKRISTLWGSEARKARVRFIRGGKSEDGTRTGEFRFTGTKLTPNDRPEVVIFSNVIKKNVLADAGLSRKSNWSEVRTPELDQKLYKAYRKTMRHELSHVIQWSHKSTKPTDESQYHDKSFDKFQSRTDPQPPVRPGIPHGRRRGMKT